MASLTTCGEQSIRTASYSTSSCNRSRIGLPPFVSFASCCGPTALTACDHNRQTPRLRRRETNGDAPRRSSTTAASGRSECDVLSPLGTPSGLLKCMESSLRTSIPDATLFSAGDYRKLRSKRFRNGSGLQPSYPSIRARFIPDCRRQHLLQ
jgi:hypothetical protein